MIKQKEQYHKLVKERVKNEKSYLIKNFRKTFKVLLVYPNSYYIGMSNLGFQTIYNILNKMENVTCDRAFLPEYDCKPISYETLSFAENFDLIIFSVSFELDFINLIKFLILSEIPVYSKKRENYPVIAAGGIAITLNYKPIINVVDYFLIGEGEELVINFVNNLLNNKNLKKIFAENNNLRAVYSGDYICHSVISTNDTEFGNTLLVEATRGCPFKCKFCAASHNYSPYRIRKTEDILKIINNNINIFNKVGLVGASVTSHPDFIEICKWLNDREINFSLTSLRLDTISDLLLEELIRGMNKTFTVAIEAGSEQLRDKVNKKLSDNDIFDAIEKFIKFKVLNLKFYFMIGLPFESMQDVESIVDMIKKIKSIYLSKRTYLKNLGKFSVSINPFIPKSNTPFFNYGMEREDIILNKIKFLKTNIKKIPNTILQYENIYSAYLQGLLSKTDEPVTDILIEKIEKGLNDKAFFKKYYKLFEKIIF